VPGIYDQLLKKIKKEKETIFAGLVIVISHFNVYALYNSFVYVGCW